MNRRGFIKSSAIGLGAITVPLSVIGGQREIFTTLEIMKAFHHEYSLYEGIHWTEEQIKILESRKTVELSINRIVS